MNRILTRARLVQRACSPSSVATPCSGVIRAFQPILAWIFPTAGVSDGRKVLSGEGPDRGTGGSQAVAPGGGEVAREIEAGERVDVAGEDFGGGVPAVKLAQEREEAVNHRRLGGAAEVAPARAQLADQPHDGNAAAHAMRQVGDPTAVEVYVNGDQRDISDRDPGHSFTLKP